ncbi:hypothetical protein DUI70_4959 [Streptomyces albus]|nr:hypothetical protein DUI70_4959 [Streptomyces albus]
MNASGSGPGRDELARLARLLPPPAERDVPSGPYLHHKDRLMTLIDIDDEAARSQSQSRGGGRVPAGAGARATAGGLLGRVRGRLPRPALWMPATALALAGAVVFGLAGGGSSGGGADSGTEAGRQGGADNAVVLLDQIAAVAAKSPATPVRDDQLVYVKSLTAGAEGGPDGVFTPGKLHPREVWMSQRPGPVKRLGVIYEEGEYVPLRELLPPGSPGVPAGAYRPTYRWLSSLPTEPGALLRELYRITKPEEGREKAQTVFEQIGELLDDTVMPPRNAAALYKAAARIPGVTKIEDAVDPAGRHGVAVSRTDKRASVATEWVFDRDSLVYLGERSYLTEDTRAGEKGTVMEETAVLRRAIVDEYRQRP